MYGFDLDGTLADTKFDIFSKAQLIAMYEKAPVLYKPRGKFVALTARGTDQQVKNATRLWLTANFGNQCEAVYFASGSEEEKINYKANKVKELGLDGYVDGKVSTLELFKKFGVTEIKLYKLNITTGEIKLWAEL